jgi:sulfur-carrier protein adenylyltransferase/sulfurtransferase
MQTGGSQPASVPEITPSELKERLDRGDRVVLLDVREPHEYAIADLPEAGQKRIPLAQIPARVGELDPDSELVVYCRSGGRSGKAAAHLMAQGFERVWNLKGGVLKWRDDVDPSLKSY